MRMLGIGKIGRVGAFALAITSAIAGCGDNGVTSAPDAPDIDAPPPKPAVLSMMPSQNDFGSVLIATTSGTAQFTVSNTGEATSGQITPLITGTNAADFTATNGCTTLAGGGTCVITVVFHPTAVGTKSGSLVVSGSPGGQVMAALLGTGQQPGTLRISPASLTFGSVTVGSPGTQQTFTVTNDGTQATTAMTTTKAGSDPAEFTTVSDNCTGQILAAAATCQIVVNFLPTTAGAKNGSYIVTAGGANTVNGAVSGVGIANARLVLTPTLQDFGTVAIGLSSANATFQLQNTGGVTTSAIGVTGTGDYTIVTDNCNTMTLAPLGICNIIVRFTPTIAGTRMGAVNVTATTGGNQSATLTGSGVPGGQIAFGIADSPFTFPGTTTGQTSMSNLFTITNTGGTATGPLGTALGGTNPSQFTVVNGSNGCQGAVLASGGVCTIAVVFNPTTGGGKAATLTVTGTPGGTAQAILNGNGIAPAQFDFDIDSSDYGSVVSGTPSAIVNFTVTNIGGQTSGTPTVALNGPNNSEFMITSPGCTTALTAAPAAGSSCVIGVRFNPAANSTGPKSATLDVLGTPGGPISAPLTGISIAQAQLAANPTILNFSGTLIGDTNPLTQNFLVTNQGSVNTGNLTIAVVGANPLDFTQTNNCEDGAGPGVDFLIPNGTCTVVVTYAPQARGDRHATVQIVGAPGGTVTVALNGINALPRLEILAPATNPNDYDFGSSIIDDSAPKPVIVQVRNNTASTQTIVNTETDTNGSFDVSAAPAPVGCGTGTNAGILSGGICTFTVRFDPLVVGTNPGSYLLSIATTATGCPAALPTCNTATQNVTGEGTINTIHITDAITTQQPDTTPTSHAFGDQAIGSSSQPRTFRVINDSDSATGILAVDLTGTGFQITNNACSGVSLAGTTGTCDVTVVFTPATVGPNQMGSIVVRSSTPTPTLGGTVTATVTGNGIAAVPIANPTMRDWGTLFAGDTATASTDKVFVVTNPNDIQTNVAFVLDANGGAYSLVASPTNSCGGTLGAGLSCNQTVRFLPNLPAGTANPAKVVVSLSVGALSATVNLSAAVKSTLSISTPTPFTDIVEGASASQTITVTNNSAQTLNAFSVAAGGAPYFILNNTCTTLGSGTACSFDLQYSPPVGSAASSNPQVLVVNANNLATGTQTGAATASVAGNTITRAAINVSQSAYNYGSEVVGQNGSTRVFTYTNLGQQTSGVLNVALDSTADFSIQANTCGVALAFNLSCAVTVRFNPTNAGSVSANLVGTTLLGGPVPGVSVTGNAISAGGLRVTPTSVVYGNITAGQTSVAQMFTVQNTSGSTAATLTIGTASGNFTRPAGAAGGTCGAALAAGASCTVFVTFNPIAPGATSATLTIGTTPEGTTTATLFGTGLTIASVTSNLGGTFSDTTPLIVPNTNTTVSRVIPVSGITGTVNRISLRLTGVAHPFPPDFDILLQAPTGERLTVFSDVCGDDNTTTPITNGDFILQDDAPGFIPAGLCASGVYKPTDRTQVFGGTDNWTAPGPGAGVASGPDGTATFASQFNGLNPNGNWTVWVIDDRFGGGGAQSIGGFDLSINDLDFGVQTVNVPSASRRITFTNNGQTAATAFTGTPTGLDINMWQITNGCQATALAPAASCNVDFIFNPTTTGAKTMSLNFTGPTSINLPTTGTGTNPASLSISPSTAQNDDSGASGRPIGVVDGTATVFTVSNAVGSSTTTAIDFTLSDTANFAFEGGSATTCSLTGTQILLPGTSCQLSVLFNPTQIGPKTTTVTATAASGGTVSGLLTGSGTEALINVTASPVAFTSAAAGAAGSSQTIQFRNRSQQNTTLVQTTLTNVAGSDFSIVSDACGGQSLAPNQVCDLVVHFTPSGAAGARTANLALQAVVVGTTTNASVSLSSSVP